MQTGNKKSNHVYDYAIIGSGLSGLAIANAISRVTPNLVLIESGDTYGGINRSIQTPFGEMNNGLRFLPDTELSHKAIAFLEMLLMTSLNPTSVEEPSITYEAGGTKPFVGFGENPPPFYEELAYFTNPRSLKLTLEPHEWSQLLFNNCQGDFLPRSYVTKFHAENGRVTQVVVNGQKNILAQNFIYCGPVKQLKTLLPEGTLNHKALHKLAKNQYWTAVGIDLLHGSPVTESSAIHVLNGTTQDEFGPCLGVFHPAAEINNEKLQYSQWLTFVDDEESEDSEVVGAALKKIKRQIKRAYPEALNQLKFERILMVPSYAGNGDLKVSGNQSLPNLENLWIGSSAMNPQKNILGALLQAEMISSALGCHPLGSQVEVNQESSDSSADSLDLLLENP